MGKIRTPRCLPPMPALLPTLALLLLLPGCANRLTFVENANAGISAKLAGTPLEPVSVNVGVKRMAGAVVPPKGPDQDAAAMISVFEVEYKEEAQLEIRLRNGFASGAAAKELANKPIAVARLFNISQDARNSLTGCLNGIAALPADQESALWAQVTAGSRLANRSIDSARSVIANTTNAEALAGIRQALGKAGEEVSQCRFS